MTKFKRVILVVVEGLGLGAAPDAAAFSDSGADTLGHLAGHFRARLQLPVLQSLGLMALHPGAFTQPAVQGHSYYGRLRQMASGKSALEDYWELLGAVSTQEPTAYPSGFSATFVHQLERQFHRPVLVNAPYQLQHLLEDYGDIQVATDGLLVSTSGGSDMVVSAHAATITGDEFARLGRFIRHWFDEESSGLLQQVTMLPFAGGPGRYYYRPTEQQIFYMRPPQPTVVERIWTAHQPVKVIAGMTAFSDLQTSLREETATGLYLVPVHEIDWAGYQRDPEKSGQRLMEVDRHLAEVLPLVRTDDLLLITANHGNDPAFAGEGSTREWLPFLAYSPSLRGGRLADRSTLADIAATIQDVLGLADDQARGYGHSFRSLLL